MFNDTPNAIMIQNKFVSSEKTVCSADSYDTTKIVCDTQRKSRLVMIGTPQLPDLHYPQTFAGVFSYSTL